MHPPVPPPKPQGFIALDVETANTDVSSICQIALVSFEEGGAMEAWHTLINPAVPFAPFNVSLHGIGASTVQDAPNLPSVMNTLSELLTGKVVASHMPFDRFAVEKACLRHGIPPIVCTWIDTARVARRAWPRFAKRGYGLRSIASHCGLKFRHHDALEDARTAGRILACAISETGVSLQEWLACCPATTSNNSRSPARNTPGGLPPYGPARNHAAFRAKRVRSLI
jgi:DNA polymerase III subunit epsilon